MSIDSSFSIATLPLLIVGDKKPTAFPLVSSNLKSSRSKAPVTATLLLNDNSSLPLATAILAKVVVLVLVTLSNILKSLGL